MSASFPAIKFASLLLCALCRIHCSFADKPDFEPGKCVDPNGKFGLCIPLKTCPKLFSILHEDPVRPDQLKFLQRSTCSFSEDEPWVCCVDKHSEEKRPTTPTVDEDSSPTESPEDSKAGDDTIPSMGGPVSSQLRDSINGHPNLKLLPQISSCGISHDTSDRIIGGYDAGLGTYPWMVLLAFRARSAPDSFQLACGGTLISSVYVLTASHCVTALPQDFYLDFVRVGEYNQSSEIDCQNEICAPKYKDIPVDEIIHHSKYNLHHLHENDVALVRLKKPAVGSFIRPICLPQAEVLTSKSSGQEPFVAGWGRTIFDKEEGSAVLQVVKVPLVPMDRCNKMYVKNKLGKLDPSTQICAGGKGGKDSCKGDSGGPLMDFYRDERTKQIHYWQMGVVSIGPIRCGGSLPAVYTNITTFMPWILDSIKP